jgi:hypothetical protein
MTNKTLTTPTIGNFTNAGHDHSNAAGGGNIADSANSNFVLKGGSRAFTAIQGGISPSDADTNYLTTVGYVLAKIGAISSGSDWQNSAIDFANASGGLPGLQAILKTIQITASAITGFALANTDRYRLFGKLLFDDPGYTVELYKDGGRTLLVAHGSSSDGTEEITLTADNASGIGGTVTIDATVAELDWQIHCKPRYICSVSGNGWTAENIYDSNGSSSFTETTPDEGFTIRVEQDGYAYTYNNVFPDGEWVNVGAAVKHSSLQNLSWSTAGHSIDTTVDMNGNQFQELAKADAAGEAFRYDEAGSQAYGYEYLLLDDQTFTASLDAVDTFAYDLYLDAQKIVDSTQITASAITGANRVNTNKGKLYGTLIFDDPDYEVALYTNSNRVDGLVAHGSRATATGSVTLIADNASGLGGTVTINYASDESDWSIRPMVGTDLLKVPDYLGTRWTATTLTGILEEITDAISGESLWNESSWILTPSTNTWKLRIGNGSAAAPALTLKDYTTTGIFGDSNKLGFSVAGVEKGSFTDTGLRLGTASSYGELRFDTQALTDATDWTSMTNLQFATATYRGAIVDYQITREVSEGVLVMESGRLDVWVDGANGDYARYICESATPTGVLLKAIVDTGVLKVQYKTSDAYAGASMSSVVKVFLK